MHPKSLTLSVIILIMFLGLCVEMWRKEPIRISALGGNHVLGLGVRLFFTAACLFLCVAYIWSSVETLHSQGLGVPVPYVNLGTGVAFALIALRIWLLFPFYRKSASTTPARLGTNAIESSPVNAAKVSWARKGIWMAIFATYVLAAIILPVYALATGLEIHISGAWPYIIWVIWGMTLALSLVAMLRMITVLVGKVDGNIGKRVWMQSKRLLALVFGVGFLLGSIVPNPAANTLIERVMTKRGCDPQHLKMASRQAVYSVLVWMIWGVCSGWLAAFVIHTRSDITPILMCTFVPLLYLVWLRLQDLVQT